MSELKGKCFSACNQGQRKKSDFYQTPYSMTDQLLIVEKFKGYILEPACGEKAIVKVIEKEYGSGVCDYYDLNWNYVKYDFLTKLNTGFIDNIITNPPFSLSKEFILRAKEIYNNKIAMLLPLSYLHGQKRYDLKIFNELKRIYVFTRYPLLTDKIRKDGKYNTGMIAYAWYIWEKGYTRKPEINWIDNNKYVLRGED